MKKMITGVVLITVIVILIGSLVVPTIQDYEDNEKVIKNNTTTRMAELVDSNHVITYDHSTKAIEIDDVDATPTNNGGLLYTDLFNILYQKSDANPVQLYSSTNTNGFITITDDMTIEIVDDDITIKYGEVELDFTVKWAYIRDNNGKYGMFNLYNQSTTLYVNSVDDLRGSNVLNTTHDWFSYEGASVHLESGTDLTADIVTGSVANTKDIVSISVGGTGTGYSFEVDNSGVPYTVHPWVVIAPIEVVGYTEVGNSIVPLLYAIPIMLIVALIVAAIALFVRAKSE